MVHPMIDDADISVALMVIQTLTPLFVLGVGLGVKIVVNQIRALREELKEYVRQESCRVYRESIMHEIDNLKNMIKFGRRRGDGAIAELVKDLNQCIERNEDLLDEIKDGNIDNDKLQNMRCSRNCTTEVKQNA